MKQLLISTCHIMVWVFGALWLVGCVSYAELPGGKTYGVPVVAEDRSPFGTNTVFPALMECTKRVQHWYKPDEFPREYCTYMADARTAPKAEPSVAPTITPASQHAVVSVRRAVTRSYAKTVQAVTTPARTDWTTIMAEAKSITPREYFSFASSQGGGYQALSGAFIGTGIGVAGAVLRPSNVTQNSNTSEFFSTKCTAPCFK